MGVRVEGGGLEDGPGAKKSEFWQFASVSNRHYCPKIGATLLKLSDEALQHKEVG